MAFIYSVHGGCVSVSYKLSLTILPLLRITWHVLEIMTLLVLLQLGELQDFCNNCIFIFCKGKKTPMLKITYSTVQYGMA